MEIKELQTRSGNVRAAEQVEGKKWNQVVYCTGSSRILRLGT